MVLEGDGFLMGVWRGFEEVGKVERGFFPFVQWKTRRYRLVDQIGGELWRD